MLAIDLFKLLRRVLGVLLAVQKVEPLVVELVGGLLGRNGFGLVEQATGSKRQRHQREGSKARRGARAAFHSPGSH